MPATPISQKKITHRLLPQPNVQNKLLILTTTTTTSPSSTIISSITSTITTSTIILQQPLQSLPVTQRQLPQIRNKRKIPVMIRTDTEYSDKVGYIIIIS